MPMSFPPPPWTRRPTLPVIRHWPRIQFQSRQPDFPSTTGKPLLGSRIAKRPGMHPFGTLPPVARRAMSDQLRKLTFAAHADPDTLRRMRLMSRVLIAHKSFLNSSSVR
jgi:hypothetical protein